jgi:hypothetical protein
MASNGFRRNLLLSVFLLFYIISFGQNVPLGIFYQAVARDNYGKELVNRDIDVKFSIISGNPLGTVVYQELHAHVTTSKFGVFSLIIGHGTPTGGQFGELSQIQWGQAYHYLKIEVKFDNDFIDMGTMQFLAVPYALYAQKSLEPGPAGPKGDPGPKGDTGDAASDDQTLSFNGSNLSISNGNTVNLSTLNVPHQLSLLGDTLSILGGNKVGLTNQLQDLSLDINNKLKITKNAAATEIDLNPFKQNLSYNNTNGLLNISNGTGADLSALKTEGIQDIHLTGNQLTIDKNSSSVGVDLSKYLDNTDNQSLTYNSSTGLLNISNGAGADLSSLQTAGIQDIHLTGNKLTIDKNSSSVGVDLGKYLDNTDNQMLTYNPSTYNLSVSGGNNVTLGSLISFRALKMVSETGLLNVTEYDFIASTVSYNDGSGFDAGTGVFTAPASGIYAFNIGYTANGPGDSRELKIYLNGSVYEVIRSGITGGLSFANSINMKLVSGDKVKITIKTGLSTESGTGSFSGYRIY